MRHPITWGGLILLMALIVGSTSPAAAVDVQGTWDAKLTCTVYPNGAKPLKEPTTTGTVLISQTGQSIAIQVQNLANFSAIASDDGVHTNKGVIGGGICPNPAALLGLLGKVSVANSGDGGSMTVDITGAVFGTGGPFDGPFKCHLTAKRSSAVDPGVALCP